MVLYQFAVRQFRLFSYVTMIGLCFLLLQGRSAFAQVDEGSIDGTIHDSTGAVVANAKVTLLNTDVGLTLETTASSGGEYIFSPVKIGHYKVSATSPGFSTTTQENLQLSVQQHLKVDIELKPGGAESTVEVTTAPPLMQTEEGSVGQVVDQRSINNLPLNGRNFTFLAQLGAGVNTPQADTRGNAASGAFSANGLRPAQNNYLLDGIDNNSDTVDFLNGTNFVILPPIEAIQEFKVQTAAFSAELGRSAGAVLNGTIKSGTNSLHGAVWEFLRNDKLDAADWFEDHAHIQKGALRQNQFGGAVGGPIMKNKIFFFADYEGLRRVQGTVSTASVPTVAERTSGFTDLSDIITGSTKSDLLGRVVPVGTVLDPATTRAVTGGAVDPVSGLVASGTGFVRDPFQNGTCGPSTKAYSLSCGLNQLPAGRIDPNAVKLLDLYPLPNAGTGVSSNYANSPKLFEHRNAMDSRLDFNFSDKDQVFARYSLADDPIFLPGPFGGIADGGAFQQGNQTALAQQSALAFTHLFSPSTVNVARVGYNHLHTTRLGPLGLTTTDYPSQFGIQGIQQGHENGGLPTFGISGLSNLGSSAFLPSDETSQTLQVTDDFTKVYGQHSFKMGMEVQHVKFTTLQPGWSRGEFDFNGNYTDIPNGNSSTTGKAQLLLSPTLSSVPGGVDDLGGASSVFASNINLTDDAKNYFAGYFQDDWKINPKLTLNLGVRYDYFGLIYEENGAQANFVPSGPPTGQPMFLLPAGNPAVANLSTSFTSLLAQDGIALKIGGYGKGLGQPQKYNISPRFGFAYQASDKLVVRGGYGMFYNAFENQGYGPNDGENYPFVFNFSYFSPGGDATPIGPGTPWAGCPTAGPGGTATLEAGLSCISFSPSAVNAKGLGLQGLQFNYKTPYTESANFTLQYSITPTMSVQAAYVLTLGRHLQAGIGNNNLSAIYPSGVNTDAFRPFPDFGHGASYQATVGASNYNGLQTKLEKQFSGGLSFLATYTWSKALSDAGDLLNGGSTGGGRASAVPGLGIAADYGLADFNIQHVVHLSGNYELPFGNHKRFLGNAHGFTEAAIGGWSMNWIATLQGGQPITINCPTGVSSAGCFALKVPGQNQKLGIHIDAQGQPNYFGNPAAFNQPCQLGVSGPVANSPTGCVPLTGAAILGGGLNSTFGPGFHRLDYSLFKDYHFNERYFLQFRAEMFNILNHPNFNAPGFGGNGVIAISNSTNFTNSNFGEIGSTRDAPYDPRQIQFALKMYF